MSPNNTTPRWISGPMRILSSMPRGAARRSGDAALADLGAYYLRDIGLTRDRPADPFRHLLRF